MIFRNSKRSDLDAIMEIIEQAKESIGQPGIDLWQDVYPSRDVIKNDILLNQSYVADDNGTICAVFSLIQGPEPTYETIYNGEWRINGSYYSLHRIAVSKSYRGQGLSKKIINWIKAKCRDNKIGSIRVNTHTGNIPMRRMLEKNGFVYCGIIFDGQERLAYETEVGIEDNFHIYDISRELFSSTVYQDDTRPERKIVRSIKDGDNCNVSDITMCVHNSTHIDAPLHFIDNASSVDLVSLKNCVGDAYVVENNSDNLLTIEFIKENVPLDCKRLLIKGNGLFDVGIATVLESRGIVLVGVENQSVSSPEKCTEVHKELLGKGIVILEGIDLYEVNSGKYELYALPIKLGGCDGAPCRAILISR